MCSLHFGLGPCGRFSGRAGFVDVGMGFPRTLRSRDGVGGGWGPCGRFAGRGKFVDVGMGFPQTLRSRDGSWRRLRPLQALRWQGEVCLLSIRYPAVLNSLTLVRGLRPIKYCLTAVGCASTAHCASLYFARLIGVAYIIPHHCVDMVIT